MSRSRRLSKADYLAIREEIEEGRARHECVDEKPFEIRSDRTPILEPYIVWGSQEVMYIGNIKKVSPAALRPVRDHVDATRPKRWCQPVSMCDWIMSTLPQGYADWRWAWRVRYSALNN
jgi:hypothetical protein